MYKHRLTILGVVLGGLGGFLYFRLVGCTSGTCPITSSPYMSTLWGMLMGGTLLNIFEKKPAKTTDSAQKASNAPSTDTSNPTVADDKSRQDDSKNH